MDTPWESLKRTEMTASTRLECAMRFSQRVELGFFWHEPETGRCSMAFNGGGAGIEIPTVPRPGNYLTTYVDNADWQPCETLEQNQSHMFLKMICSVHGYAVV